MAPDILFERRDIEIADQDRSPAAIFSSPIHAAISSRKASLWANFSLTAGSGSSPPAGT